MGGKKSKMADKLQSIEKQERAGLSSHKFFDQLLGHAGFRAKFKVARKNPDELAEIKQFCEMKLLGDDSETRDFRIEFKRISADDSIDWDNLEANNRPFLFDSGNKALDAVNREAKAKKEAVKKRKYDAEQVKKILEKFRAMDDATKVKTWARLARTQIRCLWHVMSEEEHR